MENKHLVSQRKRVNNTEGKSGGGDTGIHRLKNKENVLYRYGVMLTMKRLEIPSFVTTWLELEITTLTEVSQAQEEMYQIISLTCGKQKVYLMEVVSRTHSTGEDKGGNFE